MTTYFVTRHPGAVAWARLAGIAIDRVIDHLDPLSIVADDRVLGTLPVNLAATVCERGARYFHLSLELPPDWRGKELTVEDLMRFGAQLEEFRVFRATAGERQAEG